ncbi:MAG: DNA-binding protein [Candidatus Adiutrix sp.]|jgi:uncharacterized protein with PIN domain|nr:DNA-binding protein [Candidatus Adiutrix sp.]
MSQADLPEIRAEGWRCQKCDEELRPAPADITYMSSSFRVELPTCPVCGLVFIPPELADGKMLEVERLLEDK